MKIVTKFGPKPRLPRLMIGLCLLAAATLVCAQPNPALASEHTDFATRTAAYWKLAIPKIQTVDGVGVYADQAGTISIGRGFLAAVEGLSEKRLAASIVRFTLAHELWHLRQFDSDIISSKSRRPGIVLECEADMHAAYVVAQDILESREPSELSDFREQLDRIAELRQIPKAVLSLTTADPRSHGHLSEHERNLSIHFGYSRANHEWSSNRMQSNKIPAKQLNAFSGRFLRPDYSQDISAQFENICKHITRQGADVLAELSVFDMPGDLIDSRTPTPRLTYSTSVKNRGNRPVQFSVIGISGYKLLSNPETMSQVYLDTYWGVVDVPAGSSADMKSSMAFPAISPDKAEVFYWLGPMNANALVYARYIGEAPVPRTCADGVDQAGMQTSVLQALIRIGGAAASRFVSLRGQSPLPTDTSPLSTFKLSVAVDGAEVEANWSRNGSSFATIQFREMATLAQARQKFDQLVAEIRTGCEQLLSTEKVSIDRGGMPGFRVPRLTRQSSANLTISERGDKSKGDQVTYSVIWFVSPILLLP